ncbi:hypothetical protein GCM10023339_17670 [Alloalcanivorax gelatiniphagus]
MVGAGTALAVAVSMAVAGVTASPANAAASISIDDPGAPDAGTVKLTGKVGTGAGGVTSVLYVIDASGSTGDPQGSDCSGNGVAGGEDDFNGDASVGDVLDCEISGVLALNRSLPSAGVQVGLVGLAGTAAAADLDPAGSAAFVPPHFTGGDPRPRIESVTRSVTMFDIGLYDPRELAGGTNFDAAIQVALSTLASAPAGPKWIMFLSDGDAPVADAVLGQLQQSGVRLRSFGVGSGATCDRSASLSKLATATGETCEVVNNPASLAAALTGSQPEAVNGVSVTIDKVSVSADLDALGGWSASFTLGAGTYTATARGTLASGAEVSTQRTFTVAPSAGGPPPGSVSAGPGSAKATAIKVWKPEPTRKALPATVTGRVGRFTSRFVTTKKLEGARLVLEAQRGVGAPWRAVDRDKADRSGRFALTWRVRRSVTMLRVVLRPHRGFAGSVAAVPAPGISGCKVANRGGGWTLTCSTTAEDGSRVRLLRNGRTTSSARVRDGAFRLRGTGSVGASTVDVAAGKRHIRLPL